MLRILLVIICVSLIFIYIYDIRKTNGLPSRAFLYLIIGIFIAYDIFSFNSRMITVEYLYSLSIGLGLSIVIFQVTTLIIRSKAVVYVLMPFDIALFSLALLPILIKMALGIEYFDVDCVMAFFQTNIGEILEFLINIISVKYKIYTAIVVISMCILLSLGGIILINKKISIIACILGIISVTSSVFVSTGIEKVVDIYNIYIIRNSQTRIGIDNDYSCFIKGDEFPDSITIALIIGESLCRDYMSAYGYTVNTTPHIKELVENGELIRFNNTYSSAIFTTDCMLRILSTECEKYPEPEYLLVNLLNYLDFDSWWIDYSEEGTVKLSPITLLKHESKHILETKRFDVHDMELLPLLQQAFDSTAPRKLVICKMMGSHTDYSLRYDKNVIDANSESTDETLVEYENTVKYTDVVFNNLINMVRDKRNFILIFHPDHGEKYNNLRFNNNFDFQMTRIPLLIYISKDLQNNDYYKNLISNKDKYWVNDLTFNMICGILDIENKDVFNPQLDLSSQSYSMTVDSLSTLLYTIPLSSDNYNRNPN